MLAGETTRGHSVSEDPIALKPFLSLTNNLGYLSIFVYHTAVTLPVQIKAPRILLTKDAQLKLYRLVIAIRLSLWLRTFLIRTFTNYSCKSQVFCLFPEFRWPELIFLSLQAIVEYFPVPWKYPGFQYGSILQFIGMSKDSA
jgi:hypothetical protein